MTTTTHSTDIRQVKIPLNTGTGAMPAMGFGTLIVDPEETRIATANALKVGFRHFDCAERYKNEKKVGEAFAAEFAAGTVKREDVFITTKIWNTNHRPERVQAAFEGSCQRLGIDYVDAYLIHTPFAFQPGDNFDPRDAAGNIIYDKQTTLLDTWRGMEALVDKKKGKCRAIGLSDVNLEILKPIYEAARIKPSVVQVESHPYLPQTELLEFCKEKGIVLLAFAPLGHGMRPGPLEDPVVVSVAKQTGLTPAQVLIAWGIQRGTAILTTARKLERAQENYAIAELPEEAVAAISAIQTRSRLNSVVETGVPGFIARGR
ncbi:MAG TPA: aldo/keto reductase [Candidatus Methylacidiphilales bacterium]|jgi:aldehyde reductase|nr:aldo/keto reductase [Candidatus Methylacidiphilales bacterium]